MIYIEALLVLILAFVVAILTAYHMSRIFSDPPDNEDRL